ncbi:MAG: glycosyltransferase, partial [Patescibacteria group bacterium]
MANKLAISLVVYNGADYLPYCFNSIFNQSYQEFQLFILDNGSTDSSFALVKEISSGRSNTVVLPPEPLNIGFAAGHNKIIQQCRSEFILLLNQDTILEPDYIAQLMNFMESHSSAGAFAGKVLRWNFKYAAKLTNAGKTDIIDTTGLSLFRSGRVADRGAGEKDSGQYDHTEEVFGVSGCLPLYRVEALRQVGYFDEHF